MTRRTNPGKWQRRTPRRNAVPYTAPAATSLLFAVAMAVMAKAMNLPMRYRGHQPVYLGARARARAAGYMNVRHQQRVERERAAQMKSNTSA